MTECVNIRIPHRKLCAGDLDRKIILKNRDIQTPSSGVDFDERFSGDQRVWAAIKTTAGLEVFAGTNISEVASHVIYIRYRPNITSETWIEYRSKYYDILSAENIDERNEWYALYCNERGTTSNRSNFS